MPNRILRETILDSEPVNELSAAAEVFYRRLMSVVDDYGRFPADPRILRSRCYPLRTEEITCNEITDWMNECAVTSDPLISLYESSGKPYLVLHKLGAPRAKRSRYPGPDDPGCNRLRAYASICEHPQASDSKCLSEGGAQTPPNTNSNTNSNTNTNTVRMPLSVMAPIQAVVPLQIDFPEYFERIWGRHPAVKRRNRVMTEQYLTDALATGFDPHVLEERHKAWCAGENWQWKNGQSAKWLDEWIRDREYETPPPTASQPQRSSAPLAAFIMR